jgi:hypothetical protein
MVSVGVTQRQSNWLLTSKSRFRNSPPIPNEFAPMTELVYVLVLEAKFCEFESRLGHQFLGLKVFMDARWLVTPEEGDRYPLRPPVLPR